jgi:hypothetical protein
MAPEALKALDTLWSKTGRGNRLSGWILPPSTVVPFPTEKCRRQEAPSPLLDVVSIGIGGSYLGNRAAWRPWGRPNCRVITRASSFPHDLERPKKNLNPKKGW